MKLSASVTATHFAEQLLRDRGIKTLPIDPFALAATEGITIQAKPDAAPGVSGMLMRVGSAFGILYATHIANEGYQRFSIAHELGHYFHPGHIDAVFADGGQVHTSRAGFVSDDKYENEADHFAAGLLMPDPMFRSALIKSDDGLAGIEHLSDLCRTSLTATAIRYVQKATIPVAIVISTGTRIDYCFMSDALKEFRGIDWMRKGSPLPASVLTRDFNGNAANIADGKRQENMAGLQEWFGGGRSLEIREEVLGLGGYGKTLTVLTCDTFADEEDEEEELQKSWTPTFRKR
jgi:hypothetical protein